MTSIFVFSCSIRQSHAQVGDPLSIPPPVPPAQAITPARVDSYSREERIRWLDRKLRVLRQRLKGPAGSESARLWDRAAAVCASAQCNYGKNNGNCLTPLEHQALLDRINSVLRETPHSKIGTFVDRHHQLRFSERDLFTLTATAYGEARGFLWSGNHSNIEEKIWGKASDTLGRAHMAAVMYTVIRRTFKKQKTWMSDRRKGRTPLEAFPQASQLALEDQQFSCWHPSDAASACLITDGSSLPYQRSIEAFVDLLDPHFAVSDEMQGLSHYHATSLTNPWNFPRIAEPRVRLPDGSEEGLWVDLNEKGVSPHQHIFYRGDR